MSSKELSINFYLNSLTKFEFYLIDWNYLSISKKPSTTKILLLETLTEDIMVSL